MKSLDVFVPTIFQKIAFSTQNSNRGNKWTKKSQQHANVKREKFSICYSHLSKENKMGRNQEREREKEWKKIVGFFLCFVFETFAICAFRDAGTKSSAYIYIFYVNVPLWNCNSINWNTLFPMRMLLLQFKCKVVVQSPFCFHEKFLMQFERAHTHKKKNH